MGINIRTVYAIAWGIAAAVATIGGVFLAPITIDPTLGNVALLAFPAIILGGIDSVSGAVVGGIIIGIAHHGGVRLREDRGRQKHRREQGEDGGKGRSLGHSERVVLKGTPQRDPKV